LNYKEVGGVTEELITIIANAMVKSAQVLAGGFIIGSFLRGLLNE